MSTGLRSWIATIFRTLFHPWKSWDTVTADAASSIGLAIANCFIAALIATLPTSVFIWRSGRTVDALVALAAATAIGGVVLLLLTTVERLGIGFFGRRRGWRISPAIAWAVCGHASAGWIVCALLLAGAMVFAAFSGFSWVTSVSFNAIVLPAPRPPAIVAVAAFLLGMLIFETLVYIGFRAMRFANHPRHGANESRAASELPSDQ